MVCFRGNRLVGDRQLKPAVISSDGDWAVGVVMGDLTGRDVCHSRIAYGYGYSTVVIVKHWFINRTSRHIICPVTHLQPSTITYTLLYSPNSS